MPEMMLVFLRWYDVIHPEEPEYESQDAARYAPKSEEPVVWENRYPWWNGHSVIVQCPSQFLKDADSFKQTRFLIDIDIVQLSTKGFQVLVPKADISVRSPIEDSRVPRRQFFVLDAFYGDIDVFRNQLNRVAIGCGVEMSADIAIERKREQHSCY